MSPSGTGIYHHNHHHHPSTLSETIRNGVHSVNERSHSVGKRAAPVVRLVRVFAPTHVTTDVANFSSIVQKLTGCIAVEENNNKNKCGGRDRNGAGAAAGDGAAVVGRRRIQRSAGGKSTQSIIDGKVRQNPKSTAADNAADSNSSSGRSSRRTVNEAELVGRAIPNGGGNDCVLVLQDSSTDELRRLMSSTTITATESLFNSVDDLDDGCNIINDLRCPSPMTTDPEVSVDDSTCCSTDEQQPDVDASILSPIFRRIHDGAIHDDDLYLHLHHCALNNLVSDWSPESYLVPGVNDLPPDELLHHGFEFDSLMMMMTTSLY